jgi:hypothetical protein
MVKKGGTTVVSSGEASVGEAVVGNEEKEPVGTVNERLSSFIGAKPIEVVVAVCL